MPKATTPTTLKVAFQKLSASRVGSSPPPFSILKSPFMPRASDGSLLTAQYDSAGNLLGAQGMGVDGRHHEVTFTGHWPNQEATFSEEGEAFFHVRSYLEQIPVKIQIPIGRMKFSKAQLFYLTLWNTKLELSYEGIPARMEALLRPGYSTAFAATKMEPFHRKSAKGVTQTLWEPTAAALGSFIFPTQSFSWLAQVSPSAYVPGQPGAIFGVPFNLGGYWANIDPAAYVNLELPDLEWDITPEGNFKDELAKASYFRDLFVPPGGVNAPLLDMSWGRSVAHAIAGCVAGAVGGGRRGGLAGAGAGCLEGALAAILYDTSDLVVDIVQAPGPVGGGDQPGGFPTVSGDMGSGESGLPSAVVPEKHPQKPFE